jgi:hypothetical protein
VLADRVSGGHRIIRDDDNIQRADSLTVSAELTPDDHPYHPVHPTQRRGEVRCIRPPLAEQPPFFSHSRIANRLDELVLGLGAKTGKLHQSVFPARILQLSDAAQPEVAPESAHLLGPEPRDAEHLADAGRNDLLRLGENLRTFSRRQLFEERRSPLSHSLDPEDFTAGNESFEIALDPFHNPRGVGERAYPMDIFTLDLEEVGSLPEGAGGGFPVKAHRFSKRNESNSIPFTIAPLTAPS